MGSPSLRTGQADLPHPALQLVVLPARGVMNDHFVATESTTGDQRLGRLGIRVITMIERVIDSTGNHSPAVRLLDPDHQSPPFPVDPRLVRRAALPPGKSVAFALLRGRLRH